MVLTDAAGTEIPIAELPSPPTAWLPASTMSMFESYPMDGQEVAMVRCSECDKPIMASAVAEHAGESDLLYVDATHLAYVHLC